MFNILPYMDQQALHDQGLNGSQSGRTTTQATAVATYICPSRRLVQTYPYNPQPPAYTGFKNTGMVPSASPTIQNQQPIGRSDYAANGGGICNACSQSSGSPGAAQKKMFPGPPDLATGQSWSAAQWKAECWDADGAGTTTNNPYYGANGTMYVHSRVQMVQVSDGGSKTYLFGERYINPDVYATGTGCGDNGGWDMGYDFNTTRWATLISYVDPNFGGAGAKGYYTGLINSVQYYYNGLPISYTLPPMQDTAGLDGSTSWATLAVKPIWLGQYGEFSQAFCDTNFGSAHPAAFNMAFCDGSVHSISYSIDLTTHAMLAQRNDKNSIDPTKWQ
jgi:prepilin-type processing-associated H-X9-DG protein